MYTQNYRDTQNYCDSCLRLISRRLTDLDCIVLITLHNTHSFKNLTLPRLTEELTRQQVNCKFNKNMVYMSVLKMEALCFLECQRRSQANHFFITPDGKRVLDYINVIMEQSKEQV